MMLTDTQIANVVFNETRSLSGDGISDAQKNVAHSIVHAQAGNGKRPRTGPSSPTPDNDIEADFKGVSYLQSTEERFARSLCR